jgi:hypothetical protein
MVDRCTKIILRTFTEALGKRGFVALTTDPCMFVHKDMICLVYVDDCVFFSKDKSNINKMIASLAEDFDLKEEDNVAGFLGIELNYLEDGSI